MRQTLFVVSVAMKEYPKRRARFIIVAPSTPLCNIDQEIQANFDVEDFDRRTLKVEQEVSFTGKLTTELEQM